MFQIFFFLDEMQVSWVQDNGPRQGKNTETFFNFHHLLCSTEVKKVTGLQ